MSNDTCKKQDNSRTARGQFAPGQSGNPAGRPKGSASSLLNMARADCERIWPKVVNMAEHGNMDAIKLVLHYGMPKTRTIPECEAMRIDPERSLYEQGKVIVERLAAGDISVETAIDVMTGMARLGGLRKADTEIAEMEDKEKSKERWKKIFPELAEL